MALALTILVDNNTLIDRYFVGEPGLSVFLEADGQRVLFDTGYSDIFLDNARKLGLDLGDLDYLVLSHGHEDHTWGLDPLIRLYTGLELEKRPLRRPTVVAHPRLFESVQGTSIPEAGPLLSERKLGRHFPLDLGRQPRWLGPNLVFLGEIPRRNAFEGQRTFGRKEGEDFGDPVPEDSALAYRSPDGLVLMVGCSHAGVCNTIEYAKEVCSEDRIADVIGGFHLQSPPVAQLEGTLSYFRQLRPRCLHACHCTDLKSKVALAQVAPLEEVGVGLSLRFP
jgi:7,8-dihydropterin-6-yl-methyl-4-(beta-D-ribofuranosyl)aminobenzene 5'-phosphate synthase